MCIIAELNSTGCWKLDLCEAIVCIRIRSSVFETVITHSLHNCYNELMAEIAALYSGKWAYVYAMAPLYFYCSTLYIHRDILQSTAHTLIVKLKDMDGVFLYLLRRNSLKISIPTIN